MSEARDARALIEAAEQAAGADDYVTAARHLSAVVALQEQELGPGHPDLANTLNNLGVVLERAGQPGDAEAAYRRAYAIARDAFAPDHPFVLTSEANLRAFCETRGVPFETKPPPVEVEPAPPPKPVSSGTTAPRPVRVSAAPRRRGFPVASGLLLAGLAGLAIVWLIARPSSSGPGTPAPSASASKTPIAGPAPSSTKAPERVTPPAPVSPGRGDNTRRGVGAGSPLRIEVVRADMCRTLSTARSIGADWPCETAGETVRPGTLSFYTRIRSALPTTVEHRWYLGRSLQQRVELRISGNPVTGFRTYSRNTIGSDRAGDWRVELRSEDNVLLHEERFVVR